MAVRKTASRRNCQRISRRRAPIALRVPISRVRSLTEIVMIAMTPMPPTSRAMDEIATSARNVAPLICSHSRSAVSWVMMSKSFGSSRRSPWRMRITSVTSRTASSRATPSRGTAPISRNCIRPRRDCERRTPNCFW